MIKFLLFLVAVGIIALAIMNPVAFNEYKDKVITWVKDFLWPPNTPTLNNETLTEHLVNNTVGG